MIEIISTFNLNSQDLAILWTCPLIAGMASLIRGWTSELNLLKPPLHETIETHEQEPKRKQTTESKRQRAYWVAGMCLAGIGIGIGIAFLFLGNIQSTPSSVGLLWFLSLVLGYSTPTVLRYIVAKVKKAIGNE